MKTITKRKTFNVLIFYQILPTKFSKKMYPGEFVCEFAQNTAQISYRLQRISLYELKFFDSQVLQDARVKVTESGYIPGQAFPTEQAQLEGDLSYYRPFCTIKRSCDIIFTKNMKVT